jgi:hypothetical protein
MKELAGDSHWHAAVKVKGMASVSKEDATEDRETDNTQYSCFVSVGHKMHALT